jgi:hypothetical protein
LDSYQDESDIFYKDPHLFISTYFSGPIGNLSSQSDDAYKEEMIPVPTQNYLIKSFKWPSHVVFFEPLLNVLKGVFNGSDYKQVSRL